MRILYSGAITPWSYPELLSDGLGGAIYSWYDSPTLSSFNVWVQHIDEGKGTLQVHPAEMNRAQGAVSG